MPPCTLPPCATKTDTKNNSYHLTHEPKPTPRIIVSDTPYHPWTPTRSDQQRDMCAFTGRKSEISGTQRGRSPSWPSSCFWNCALCGALVLVFPLPYIPTGLGLVLWPFFFFGWLSLCCDLGQQTWTAHAHMDTFHGTAGMTDRWLYSITIIMDNS